MNNLLSINLGSSVAPKIQEVRGRDYIEYSDQDGLWKNNYPNFLIDLYYNSSTHSAIINSTSDMIAGEDLVVDEDEVTDLIEVAKLKAFLKNANSNESWHQVIKKVAFDFKLQGGYAIHVIYNRERTAIVEAYHVPVERVRAGRPNEMGKVDTYYISADWSNVRANKPYPVAAFNTNDRTSGSQLIYSGSYSPNMDIYYTPDYLAGNNWIMIDAKISEYHLNNINNGFSGSYMFSFNNGIPLEEERNQIERDITGKLTSAANAGKFLMSFSDDKTRAPEIHSLNAADLSEQYINLQTLIVQNIVSAHRVTSKTLLGIDTENGFSSSADELLNASNFYLNQVIRPFQLNILGTLGKIFAVNQIDLPIRFVQLKPITIQFDSETIRSVMTTDEIREDLGLPALEGKVDEELSTQLSEEKTELESFIEEFGEDMPKGYEILSEEEVEEEVEDFDFENELNTNHYQFASTGSAYPNRKSGQDQKSKQTDYVDDIYRVRYRYTGSLTGERDFCRKMTSKNKIYRKEDIIAMGSKAVNPGWGKYGANTYSIWKWKGGGLCKHKWFRIILVQEGKRPKNSDKIISSTEAKSRGIKLPRNAKEVSVAPHDMPNHGFVNPELIAKYKNV